MTRSLMCLTILLPFGLAACAPTAALTMATPTTFDQPVRFGAQFGATIIEPRQTAVFMSADASFGMPSGTSSPGLRNVLARAGARFCCSDWMLELGLATAVGQPTSKAVGWRGTGFFVGADVGLGWIPNNAESVRGFAPAMWSLGFLVFARGGVWTTGSDSDRTAYGQMGELVFGVALRATIISDIWTRSKGLWTK